MAVVNVKEYYLNISLRKIKQYIPDEMPLQVNRSFLINLKKVISIIKKSDGRYRKDFFVNINDNKIKVSGKYVRKI